MVVEHRTQTDGVCDFVGLLVRLSTKQALRPLNHLLGVMGMEYVCLFLIIVLRNHVKLPY